MKLKKTIVAISISRSDECPLYGNNTTTVSLAEEGGGKYVQITQPRNPSGGVSLDPEEVVMIAEVARELLKQESE